MMVKSCYGIWGLDIIKTSDFVVRGCEKGSNRSGVELGNMSGMKGWLKSDEDGTRVCIEDLD